MEGLADGPKGEGRKTIRDLPSAASLQRVSEPGKRIHFKERDCTTVIREGNGGRHES